MKNIYERAIETIKKLTDSYDSLSEAKKSAYDDLVVLENCDLPTSGFETEEEKEKHMQLCIQELTNNEDQ